MRTLVLLGWLMVPVVFGAYHYGPGQEKLRLDDVSRRPGRGRPARGRRAVASGLVQVRGGLDDAAGGPGRRFAPHPAPARQGPDVRSASCPRPTWRSGSWSTRCEDDKTADPKLRDEAREALANAQYYMTWLMRLEGLSNDEWEPEIESARQTYTPARRAGSRPGRSGIRAKASRGPRERHPPGPVGSRRAARSRSSQAMLELQERPVQETRQRQEAVDGKKPGKEEEKKDSRKAGAGPPPDNSGS